MQEFSTLGRFLIILGLVFLIIGLLINFLPKIPYLGKLPGDIHIRRENFTFYFPLATSLLLSLLITIILNLILRR
ncbi:MAG: DUF2905 domain-containing protein [Caldimicrobium sp.]|nr:DUF2905 domain-containing protein [Caldimicrobium sp.]MDW8094438.1 DUF2905 domain-containing protein [Caldimicrobium sp.]